MIHTHYGFMVAWLGRQMSCTSQAFSPPFSLNCLISHLIFQNKCTTPSHPYPADYIDLIPHFLKFHTQDSILCFVLCAYTLYMYIQGLEQIIITRTRQQVLHVYVNKKRDRTGLGLGQHPIVSPWIDRITHYLAVIRSTTIV